MLLRKMILSTLGASLVVAAAFGAEPTKTTQDTAATGNYGVGDPDIFASRYLAFKEQQLRGKNPNSLVIPIGQVKGVVRAFTGTAGALAIDLTTGAYTLNISGLENSSAYTFYLIDRQDHDSTRSVAPADQLFKVTDFKSDNGVGVVSGVISPSLLGGAALDEVKLVLTAKPAETVASGSVNIFQKMFFGGVQLTNSVTGQTYATANTTSYALSGILPKLSAKTLSKTTRSVSTSASGAVATASVSYDLDRLISDGANLFFNEAFEGNGRTCGSCHPATNNFTIDPAFIATRPSNDPLFVAEFNPALFNLEKPQLMRQFGLILENVDGLEDPINKFVMRSVPHTLGMQVSLNADITQIPTPAQMTGWSGDGAPGTGSLRDFATGAVTQHFTRSLQRFEGPDFRLPDPLELDAMEAFQLSLGREKEFDLATITFVNPDVEAGKLIFLNGTGDPNAGGRCAVCHNNAGANFNPGSNAVNPTNPNRNLNTNVENRPHPARSVVQFPIDGGFGGSPANADGSFGNRAFNITSVVEAADTPPFFHNNVVDTLEGVVDFYAGPEFSGIRAAGARFAFTSLQRTQVANFMRGINILQNIDVAQRELQEILDTASGNQTETLNRLQTAFSDVRDGITVTNQGSIGSQVASRLTAARNFISQAQQPNNANTRGILVQRAIDQLVLARANLATLPKTLVTDNFQRANGDLGPNWSATAVSSAPLQITNSRVEAPFRNYSESVYTAANFASNQFSEVQFVSGLDSEVINILVRVRQFTTGGTEDGYIGQVFSGLWRILRLDNQVETEIARGDYSYNDGDTFSFEANGSVLRLKRNGTVLGSVSDSTYTSGRAGFGLFNSDSFTVDNWRGGDL